MCNNEYEEKEIFNYLSCLQKSGHTNMILVGSFLSEEFGMSQILAQRYIGDWIRSFNQECDNCE